MSTPPPLPVTEAPEAPPSACVNCGATEFSTHTKLPVCETCRMALVRFPFPVWVKLSAFLVLVMVVVSLLMSGERLQETLQITRAQKMAKQMRWEEAYQAYHAIIEKHTNDTDVMLSYAEAAIQSGHTQDAVNTMKSLAGRSADSTQMNRAQSVTFEIERLQRLHAQPTNLRLPPTPSR